jgi:hypothetical protein
MCECVICYEPMYIPAFITPTGPEETREVQVMDDDTRLACGHAYHTHCIIRSIIATSKCPLCNITSTSTHDYSDDVQLRIEGRGRLLLEDARKSPEVKEKLKEWRVARKTFAEMERIFRKRTKAFKDELRKELNADAIIKEHSSAFSAANRTYNRVVRKLGPVYYAAAKNMNSWQRNKFLFKIDGWRAFSRWRLRATFY